VNAHTPAATNSAPTTRIHRFLSEEIMSAYLMQETIHAVTLLYTPSRFNSFTTHNNFQFKMEKDRL
jgi:phospholipase/lecithinase/hemolysin